MHWGYTLQVVGVITMCVGGSMILPLAYGVLTGDDGAGPLALSLAATVAAGAGLHLFCRRFAVRAVTHRDGMAVTTLGWVFAGFFGALPFWLDGTIAGPTDAVFESLSGFTTTGATIMPDVEALPKSLLLWRSLTQWLGGMGIIVLSLAILPFLGLGGMQLYKAEVPGPVPDKLRPRIKDTALLLWKVYLLFTVLQTVLLYAGGMNLFDATCHTFATLATGGFSTRNASIGSYGSWYIDAVTILFMLIAGINFTLHFQVLRGRPAAMWRDPEWRFFMGAVALFTLIVTLSNYRTVYPGIAESFRYSLFQVVSLVTTTGFGTADYELWSPLCQALLLLCMFLGGSAGSTAGGMKNMRVMLLIKHAYNELFRLVHPRSVVQLKLGGKIVRGEVFSSIWGFVLIYLGLYLVAGLLLSGMGMDLVSAFGAAAATIGNIGPGLGSVGPTDHYAHVPMAGKWVLTLCMLLGRLEIYTVMVLCIPEFWRK